MFFSSVESLAGEGVENRYHESVGIVEFSVQKHGESSFVKNM